MANKRKLGIRKPSLPKRLRRNKPDAQEGIPRITNESVAEHREEVLGRARKFIYPLRHSRNRVVKLSISIVVSALLIFLIVIGLLLYKFQSTSSFVYGVTRVVPFPVGWADGRLVSYESYLFELRHYMHYYQTQQDVNFDSKSGQRQLASLKQRSLDEAFNRAYVAKLASQHHVHVTPAEVNQQVQIAKTQNRLGASEAVFESVLQQFWGWSVSDFKHELSLELLDQKLAATLDTSASERARDAYLKLQSSADFAKLASQVSDDTTTKASGGKYNFAVTETNQDLSPLVVQAIFGLDKGQHSGVIDTGYTLEIVKVLSVNKTQRQAAHMAFQYKDISTFIGPVKAEHKPKAFISVK
jgi:hypothetical protein